jgi:hypothetical protein
VGSGGGGGGGGLYWEGELVSRKSRRLGSRSRNGSSVLGLELELEVELELELLGPESQPMVSVIDFREAEDRIRRFESPENYIRKPKKFIALSLAPL